MDSQPMLQAEWDALKRTIEIASSLAHELKTTYNLPDPKDTPPPNLESTIPPFSLPFPLDILAPIHNLEISQHVRLQILDSFHTRIKELQDRYTQSYKQACLETARHTSFPPNFTSIHGAYQALYHRQCIPLLKTQVSFALSEVDKYRHQISRNSKRPFNNEYTPFLEKYFQYNAYPSVAHRLELANNASMNPRQIEVWFQNHRNRAKKDGKDVRRSTTDFPLRQALGFLHSDLDKGRLPTPCDEIYSSYKPIKEDKETAPSNSSPLPYQEISVEPVQDSASSPKRPCILDDNYNHRPAHAFPMTKDGRYPDPFPTQEGIFKLPVPIWRRKAATHQIVRTAMDMDELAQLFHLKLNFCESSRRRGTTPAKGEYTSPKPWFTSTTTFACPAPHPAAIRASHVSPISSLLPLELVLSKPAFGLISWPASSNVPPSRASVRKMKPLPRRVAPQRPSKPFGSRTSSFSSDISSSSLTSSSSNYASSPELSTPPPLPSTDLPELYGEYQHDDLFDFSHAELATDDYPLSHLLSLRDFNTNSSSSTNKFTDTLFFHDNLSDFGHNLEDVLC